MMVTKHGGLGWRPDTPDWRDSIFSAPHATAELPPMVDLRSKMPGIYDQGDIGSCTGNAIAAAFEYCQRVQKIKEFVPSRLFIYFCEREMENSIASDAGAEIRDGIKAVVAQGVCPESPWHRDPAAVWPYDVKRMYDKPPKACYDFAVKGVVKGYARVTQSRMGLQQCLAAGFPIIFGFSVYESLLSDEVARTGLVPMPKLNEKMLGGHAVLAVGYDMNSDRLLVRNSWGKKWGALGYCAMSFNYVTNENLASDFWCIRAI